MAGFRGDQILVVAVAFLAGFGLLAQNRLGAFAPGGDASGLTDFAFVGGLGIMLALALGFMSGRYRTLAEGHWVWVWAGISLLLVLVLLVTGQRFRGAVFGAGFITPTEVLKVTLRPLRRRLYRSPGQGPRRLGLPWPAPALAPARAFGGGLGGPGAAAARPARPGHGHDAGPRSCPSC